MEKNTKKLILIISCILAVLIAASVAAYAIWKDSLIPGGTDGSSSTTSPTSSQVSAGKEITVVVRANGNEYRFSYKTEAEFLREALEEVDLIKGDESEYGLFVTEVYGIKADPEKRQWWKITRDGQDLMTGVDTTPIGLGGEFCFILDTY